MLYFQLTYNSPVSLHTVLERNGSSHSDQFTLIIIIHNAQ